MEIPNGMGLWSAALWGIRKTTFEFLDPLPGILPYAFLRQST